MYILSCLILFLLCIIGLTDIAKVIILRFLKIKNDKSIILISPLNNNSENTEFFLRSCITKIRWMDKLRPNRIIFLDTGMSDHEKNICTLIRKEYDYIEVMTPSEFSTEFFCSKEFFNSSKEL